jgi:hypothetical protein
MVLKKVGGSVSHVKGRSIYINLPEDSITADNIYMTVMDTNFWKALSTFDLAYNDDNYHSAVRDGRDVFFVLTTSITDKSK